MTSIRSRAAADNGDAPGVIRLGVLAEDGRPFDIAIGELGQQVFLRGASGTGKTTTIARLADGALANGYGVVIWTARAPGSAGLLANSPPLARSHLGLL